MTDIAKKLDPSNAGTNIGGLIDPGGEFIKRFTGSDVGRRIADPLGVIPEDGIAAASESRAKIGEEIGKRKKKEQSLLLKSKKEIDEKKAVATRTPAGRSLLIATSPTGVSTTLGGT